MDRRQSIAEQRKRQQDSELVAGCLSALFWLFVRLVAYAAIQLWLARVVLLILSAFGIACGFLTALTIVLAFGLAVSAPLAFTMYRK
jgi:hypothetical protein